MKKKIKHCINCKMSYKHNYIVKKKLEVQQRMRCALETADLFEVSSPRPGVSKLWHMGQMQPSSCFCNRSYMRLTEKEDESLPIDIVLQTLLAFAVTCYGIVHIAGEFKDMDATSELKNKTFDTLRNHPSFYVFNHRGRVLFRPSDTTNTSNQDALSSNTSLKLRKLESLRR
ncbi:ER membrane protein complex subunit 5 isoform 1-T1 [Trichechus inunguis]